MQNLLIFTKRLKFVILKNFNLENLENLVQVFPLLEKNSYLVF